MKKHVLKLEDSPQEFEIIGISSHENDYRLSWAINQEIGMAFKRFDNYIFSDKKNNLEREFSQFHYFEEDMYIHHLILSNKGNTGFLIPELKNMDFFLVILGEYDANYVKTVLDNIKSVSIISVALPLALNQLKSKRNFNFSFLEI